MPPLLVGAAIAFGGAVIAGATIAVAFAVAAFSLALNVISSIVFKPKAAKSFSEQAQERTITVRQPTEPWSVVYGEIGKKGGVFALISKPEGDALHLIIVLAGREVDGIGDIWFDDEIVPLDSDGFATGRFAPPSGSTALVVKHLGGAGQAADTTAVAEVTEWTADHRLRGKPYIYVRLQKNQDLFPNGVPNITATVRGHRVFDPRDGGQSQADPATWKWSPNPALIIADYLTNKDYGLGVTYAVEINQTALIAAANVCDEAQSVSFSTTFTAKAVSNIIKLPVGVISMTTGQRIELLTTGTLPAPLTLGIFFFWIRRSGVSGFFAASETDAINGVAIDILDDGTGIHTLVRETSTDFVADAATDALTPSVKDVLYRGDGVQLLTTGTLPAPLAGATTYFIIPGPTKTVKLATTLADAIAGTAINLTNAGTGIHTIIRKTETRYQANGTFKTSESPDAILRDMFSAMAGRPNLQGATWVIKAGAFESATITLDEDDLRDGIKVVTRIRRRELFNAIKGVYVSPANKWHPADIPVVTNAAFETEDNGERIWHDEDLAYTISSSMAQRILKIKLEQGRQQIAATYPTTLTALRLTAGDTVKITNSRFGWSAKDFDIPEWHFNVQVDDDDNAVLTIDLAIRETASAVFDWNAGEERVVDPAPDTNLPDPFTAAAPGPPVVTEALFEARKGGGIKVKALVTWGPPLDPFVTEGGKYQLETKAPGAAAFVFHSRPMDPSAEVQDIEPGVWGFRVKSINQIGVESDYATSTVEIFGLSVPPQPPAGLTITAIGTIALARWDALTELDVKEGGTVIFRHSPELTGATWQASTSIGKAVAGRDTSAVMPLKAGTYLAKTVDAQGIPSINAATAVTKGGTALAFGPLSTLIENPDFPGAHSGTVAADSLLKLAGAGLFDTIADFDAVPDLDAFGGIAASGTYTFSVGIDLGVVKNTRLRSTLSAIVVNTLDLIDERTALIDDWEDFDGTAAASADAQVWARETDDDPAGAPTWSAYERLDAAEFKARGFQFEARLSTDDAAYNIHVTQLRIDAEEVV